MSDDCKACGACAKPERCECCGACRNCGKVHLQPTAPVTIPAVPYIPSPIPPISPFPAQPWDPPVPWYEVTCGTTKIRTDEQAFNNFDGKPIDWSAGAAVLSVDDGFVAGGQCGARSDIRFTS